LLRTDKIAAPRPLPGRRHPKPVFLPLPLSAAELRKVGPAVVAEVDRLLDDHTDSEIVDILNSGGFRPGVAERFSLRIIYILRRSYAPRRPLFATTAGEFGMSWSVSSRDDRFVVYAGRERIISED